MRKTGVFLMMVCALALCATFFFGARVGAQTVAPPNCHVWQSHTDNPFDQRHYYAQPAIAWDVEYASLSLATAKVIERVAPISPLSAALVPAFLYGGLPHLLGFAQGRYPITMHWAFTLSDRSLPVALALRDTAHDASRIHPLTTWFATTGSLLCFDR